MKKIYLPILLLSSLFLLSSCDNYINSNSIILPNTTSTAVNNSIPTSAAGNGNLSSTYTYIPLPPVSYVRYTVTFDSRGGSPVEPFLVIEGNPIARPDAPTYEGYFFSGWYREAELVNMWDFERDRVNEDLTLFASWTEEIITEPTASLTYQLETNGYVVTGVGEETIVYIPETYNDRPVIAIGENAFQGRDITSVTLPDSIEEIGLNAFHNDRLLETVNIGTNSKLTTIRNNAFSGNSSLTSFYFPEGLITLGDDVFNNCSSIESFLVHENNQRYEARNGHLIDRQTNTIVRGSNNPIVPEGVVGLQPAAFRRSKLEQISLPSTLTTIGNYSFNNCDNLKEITVSANNRNFSSLDGVLYNKNQTELILAPLAISDTISLPSTLTSIPSSAFNNRASLSNIFIPDGDLESIGFQAFNRTTLHIYFGGSETAWNAISKNTNWGGNNLEITFNATLESIPEPSTTLIVYFSWSSGNRTEGVAQHIQTKTNGDMVEIIPETPYTSNYDDLLVVARTELNQNARPAISQETLSQIDIDDYSTVFIGYPIWHGSEPMIIRSFIDEFDGLADKLVYPFSTSASSSGATAYNNIRRLCEEATVPSYLHLNNQTLGNSETLVNNWIDGMTSSTSLSLRKDY